MPRLCRKCTVSEAHKLLVFPACYSREISDGTFPGYVAFSFYPKPG